MQTEGQEVSAVEKVGEITGVSGGMLEITFCRPQDCGHCHACEGGQTPTVIRVKGEGRVGDYAAVELPTGTVVKASLLAYALPIAGLLLGMLAGQAIGNGSVAASAIGGGACFGLCVLAVLLTEKRRRASSKWQPTLTKVFPRESYGSGEPKGEETNDHSADD